MSKRNGLIAAAAFLLGVFVSNGQSRVTEGAKPYSLTRLQWLALDMEARMHMDMTDRDGISFDFVSLEEENAILLHVRYLPRADREIMNQRIEIAKNVINIKAKYEGWSSWLKIREDVKMAEPNAK
jgi:hypothetical protein